MKRLTVRICVLLLLGAIVNVAVAWGCAAWSVREEFHNIHFNMPAPLAVTSSERAWLDNRVRIEDGLEWTFGELRGRGFFRREYFAVDEALFRPQFSGGGSGSYPDRVAVTRSGCPCYALECEDYHVDNVVSWDREYRYAFPITVEVDFGGPIGLERPLPYRPIWPGFAINTVLYAFILWLLFAAPFALRRRRRIKRGLCPKCAYPVGESPVCTECGTLRKVKR